MNKSWLGVYEGDLGVWRIADTQFGEQQFLFCNLYEVLPPDFSQLLKTKEKCDSSCNEVNHNENQIIHC